MIIHAVTDLIGNTPLLKLDPAITGLKNIDLYAKLELMNPFGSIKDRTAWALIKDDLATIKDRGMTIYENSSGNTAKSLQAIAGMHGIPFRLVSALAKVEEQKQVLQVLGAEIEEIAEANDCFDPSDNNDPQYLIERTAKARPGEVFFTSQFSNQKNPDYHEQTTGEEIVADLGCVDFFFNGLGTTGSSLGISRRLKKENSALEAIAVVPEANQFLPGIRSLSQMFESGLYQQDQYTKFMTISEQQAIDGMLTLNRKAGILCGVTAGGNYFAAVQYLSEIDQSLTTRKKAVFIACDRMEWYLSYLKERRPELFGEKPKPGSFANFTFDENASAPQLSVENLGAWIKDFDPLIIDIRSAMAFRLHHIENSLNIPQDTFERLLNQGDPFPKNRTILLVCAVGERTKIHAAYLQQKGYRAFSLLDGVHALVDRPELLKAA